jgi:hypothetical protein
MAVASFDVGRIEMPQIPALSRALALANILATLRRRSSSRRLTGWSLALISNAKGTSVIASRRSSAFFLLCLVVDVAMWHPSTEMTVYKVPWAPRTGQWRQMADPTTVHPVHGGR